MMRLSRMKCGFRVIQFMLVLVATNVIQGHCVQEPANDLARRMEALTMSPPETNVRFEFVANFTSAWNESNDLDETHYRLIKGIEQQFRKEFDSLPQAIYVKVHDQIDTLAREEIKRAGTFTPSPEPQSQRSKQVALRKYVAASDEIYERLLRERFKDNEKLLKAYSDGAYTVKAQDKRIEEIFQSCESTDPVVARFFADLFLFELKAYGPNGLFRHPLLGEIMHWPTERMDAIIFGFDYEGYEMANIAPIKRSAMSDFLQILTEPQREMLSRKLGIKFAAISQLADITPASDLKRIFSESIGELPINHSARNRLLSSAKSALATLRQFTAAENIDASDVRQALQVVSTNLSSFPPGEFGDLSELAAEFESELSQMKDGSNELRPELSRLVDDFRQYQKDAAVPWKWPGVVDLDIQTSFGELEDDQLKNDVPISLKRAFCNLASARSLKSDPSEFALSCVQSVLDDDNFWFPGTELWKIRNAQVDHPRKYDFENHADRLAESKVQLALIIDPLVPRQSAELSARYAQYLFAKYGPYNYFQRPDFAAEFKITPEQQKRLDEVAKRISGNIEEQIHPVVMRAMQKLFEQLSDEERQKVEGLLGCKWADASIALLQIRGERVLREMMIDPYGSNFQSRRPILEAKIGF